LSDLAAAVEPGGTLPANAVLVTFDDADRSVLDVALPILRSAGVPAVAFVVAGVLGSTTPFWWEEAIALSNRGPKPSPRLGDDPDVVRAMKQMPDGDRLAVLEELRAAADVETSLEREQLKRDELSVLESGGIEVGNHTLTHPCLPRCPDEKVEREIRDAHESLSAALGHEPRSFAYPNGDWDAHAEPILRDLGYEFGFLFDHRRTVIGTRDLLRLSRIRVDASSSIDRFAILVSGLHSSIHQMRGLP
jgi:peptidoglycan/xylan/chitin deacetylase (PgdA/CDA1 family)